VHFYGKVNRPQSPNNVLKLRLYYATKDYLVMFFSLSNIFVRMDKTLLVNKDYGHFKLTVNGRISFKCVSQ